MIEDETMPQDKLLIMYILEKMGNPITDNVLQQIYFSVNDINYFYFAQYLGELVSKEWIATFQESGATFYEITPKGIEILEELDYLLPNMLKHTANQSLDKTMKGLQYELSVDADFIILDIDKINVNCYISEGTSKLFSLEIYAGTMEQARKIAQNWKDNALKYYPQIIQMLTEEKE